MEDIRKIKEREFEDCEKEGFVGKFISPYEMGKDRNGESFKVLRRIREDEVDDIYFLPMWEIRFEDGTLYSAYPEEVVLSKALENGASKSWVNSILNS